MTDFYNIIISPETIKGDIFQVDYSGETVGVYSAMTQVLTAGPDNTSLLTGLTIPILIRQTAIDSGYYSPFDGAILQKDVVTNFLFSATTGNPYRYYVYNTSSDFQKFLELAVYTVDWGDGSPIQTLSTYAPQFVSHDYPIANKEYTITLEQLNPWGLTQVRKIIRTPYTIIDPPNPEGTAYFIPLGGSWSGTPIDYNYIFSGDAVNEVAPQISANYVSVPYTISGETKSRLKELQQYGPTPYIVGVPVISNGEIWGAVTNINPIFTAYTITGVDYYDYPNGQTLFFEQSSGFTTNNLTAVPITKDESLLKVMDQPQIQTDVFVERGKNSALERIMRLGEVDNLGDMVNYGYGFFNIVEKKG